MKKFISLMIALSLIALVGCSPIQKTKTLAVCPGSKTPAQSLSLITSQNANATPFKISSATCHWVQRQNDKKTYDENFPIKIWVSPPDRIRLQGDIAFDPAGMVLGANQNEFWLAIKPKEISSYYWGIWNEQTSLQNLILSPKTLLEAFALIDAEDSDRWSLATAGPYDVLSKNDSTSPVKKIYIYNCENRISKVEYLNAQGQMIAETILENYRKVRDDFYVPHKIKITTYLDKNSQDTFAFTIKSAKPVTLSAPQQRALFERPDQKGYKHIYKSAFGKFLEQ